MQAWPLRIPQEQFSQRYNTHAVLGGVFTARECRQIIELVEQQEQIHEAVIDQKGRPEVAAQVRQSRVAWLRPELESYAWIYQRCTAAVLQVNNHDWQFDLDYIDPLQFTLYTRQGDHYGWHIDNLSEGSTYRKLSFSVQLSQPAAYDGGDLEILMGPEATKLPREQGVFTAFPSITTHRVTPVTRGERYSLVGWCTGPKFR
jgi:PKHD-type hydroxylase